MSAASTVVSAADRGPARAVGRTRARIGRNPHRRAQTPAGVGGRAAATASPGVRRLPRGWGHLEAFAAAREGGCTTGDVGLTSPAADGRTGAGHPARRRQRSLTVHRLTPPGAGALGRRAPHSESSPGRALASPRRQRRRRGGGHRGARAAAVGPWRLGRGELGGTGGRHQ